MYYIDSVLSKEKVLLLQRSLLGFYHCDYNVLESQVVVLLFLPTVNDVPKGM